MIQLKLLAAELNLNAKTRSPGVAFDDQHVLLLFRLLLFSFLAPLRAFPYFLVFP